MSDGQWYEGDEVETFIDNFYFSSWSVGWKPDITRGILQREGIEPTRAWESESECDVSIVAFYGDGRALVILCNGEYADWAVIPLV